MLLDYLKKNYEEGEPIFISDIVIDNMSFESIRQQFKKLTDAERLIRYEQGIYYMPKVTRLKGASTLSPDIVARYKYISRNGKRIGYYSGYTLANMMGISTQVPNKAEIVSNNMAAIVREIRIGNREYIIRKPVIEVNEDNYIVLQLLEVLKSVEEYSDDMHLAKEQICSYISRNKITRDAVDKCISYFPLKTYKSIYEMRLENVFA